VARRRSSALPSRADEDWLDLMVDKALEMVSAVVKKVTN
jgi:hypothetical protein